MLAEKLEEARALGRVGGRLLLEREAAGRVEDDGLVGEPPVAVAGAPRARERVGADGELEISRYQGSE